MKDKRGSILAVTISFILIFAMLGISAMYVSGLQNEAMTIQSSSNQAFWLADAGINQAIWRLNEVDPTQWYSWETTAYGYQTSYPQTVGFTGNSTGNYELELYSPTGINPTILSYGYVPVTDSMGTPPSKDGDNLAKRIVEVRLYKNSFNFGIVGDDFITTVGTIETDSYNSNDGAYGGDNVGENGDVATNGDITMSGGSFIDGDATIGPDGTFSGEDSQVSGEIITNEYEIPLPPVVVPATLIALSSEGTVGNPTLGELGSVTNPITGNHKFDAIKHPSGELFIKGPAELYLTAQTSLSAQSDIRIIEGSTGPVHIYADGDVSIQGEGIINDTLIPKNFIFYSTGSLFKENTKFDITLSGDSAFYGAVYAPLAGVKLSGTNEVYGSIVGQSLTVDGTATIHYDEALADEGTGDKKYSLQNWREIYEE